MQIKQKKCNQLFLMFLKKMWDMLHKLKRSHLCIYLERITYRHELLSYNMVNLFAKHDVVNTKLTQFALQHHTSYTNYNFDKFCKYQLRKYKPWHENPESAWDYEKKRQQYSSYNENSCFNPDWANQFFLTGNVS